MSQQSASAILPASANFVHLHCHTEYSLLDGAIRLDDLAAKTAALGMPAIAITDHGNLFGAIHFYNTCKKYKVKPIIGCEVYVCHDHTDRTSQFARQRFHLVLLAANQTGYSNLVKLVTQSYMKGFHYRPRVDKALLQHYNEGIIALSACLAGEVPKALLNNGMDAGIALAREYAEIFAPTKELGERFYLELQSNGIAEQEIVNNFLLEVSQKTSIPLVATNDCHYLEPQDVEAHDILLCIQTQRLVTDTNRMKFDTTELYYKTPEEMQNSLGHYPNAIENTVRIAEKCTLDFKFDEYIFPNYKLTEGMTLDDEFRTLSRQGLTKRLEKHPQRAEFAEQKYWERLEYELDVIIGMGFPGYFLIVQDFINWAKNNAIPVGPGRGSAAGSLVAWALRITNLDPMPYNLLFERFLNSERISMPDIDVDFCERRRGEVIRYVADQYGHDMVAQITTFGKMKTKAVIRDVGRALGMSFAETDRIAKLIPEDLKMTINKALQAEPVLADLYRDDPTIRKLIDVSLRLEGLSRHASTHAAGVVISDKPMNEYLPLYKGKREETVTQFDMKIVEKIGLVKFDFLGLRTMTLIQDTLDIITLQGKEAPDLDTLTLDDAETYQLYTRGDTDGVFQVESSGMRQYLRQLRPTCFEDIIAMLALYRPGPLGSGMVEQFIKRKHGEMKVSYPLPDLEHCLKDTYGVIVYQEQVMQIAQIVASYTLGNADLLRRAMGKKDAVEMQLQRALFEKGAADNNHPPATATEIFDLMEKFAEYGFNKSHSAAYALISYHTAYLKVHYSTEFMAALLGSEMGNQDKLLKYIAACKDMEIEVMQPNIQLSRWRFIVHENTIVFGLGGVKSVGEEAVNELIAAREKDGPFTSFFDLCCRVPLRKITKRVLENLIKGGACDCLGCTRASLLASLDSVVSKAQKKQKEKDSNQVSLFSIIPQEERPCSSGIGFDCPEQKIMEWADDQKLAFEKEALGFYLTSHPLQPYRRAMEAASLTPLEEIRELSPEDSAQVGVIVTGIKEILTKKGEKMAIVQIEDLTAAGECVFFPQAYAKAKPFLEQDKPLFIKTKVAKPRGEQAKAPEPTPDTAIHPVTSEGADTAENNDEEKQLGEIKLLADDGGFSWGKKALTAATSFINTLDKVCYTNDRPYTIQLVEALITEENLKTLKAILQTHKGDTQLNAQVLINNTICLIAFSHHWSVTVCAQLETDIDKWLQGVHNDTQQ